MSTPRDDRMVSRIPSETSPSALGASILRAGAPKFNIIIAAEDGAELVRMTEDARGHLVVTGDESRWDEGAMRFLHGMMQWSGAVGVRWKDEVLKAMEGH